MTDTTRDSPPHPAPVPGWLEWSALILLLPGSLLVPFVGWLAGVALLWRSRVWTVRDKLVGTLVIPGGYATISLLALRAVSPEPVGCTKCGNDPWVLELAVIAGGATLLIAPAAAVLYLWVRAKRMAPPAQGAHPMVSH